MNETKLIQQLGEALQEASDHLDYCGYGDKWERECAEASGLRPKVEAALRALDERPKPPHLLRARVAGDTIRDLIEALQQLDPDLKHDVDEVTRVGVEVSGLGGRDRATIAMLQQEVADEAEWRKRLEEALRRIAESDILSIGELKDIAAEELL